MQERVLRTEEKLVRSRYPAPMIETAIRLNEDASDGSGLSL